MECGITRREFIKGIVTGLVSMQLDFPFLLNKAEAVTLNDINPLKFIEIINFKCFECTVRITGCVKIRWNKVRIAPKIHYWSPVAFIETGKAWEVREIPYAPLFADLMSPLSKVLPIPEGSESYFSGTGHQTYLKVYPHYFGFPEPVAEAVASVISLLKMNPVCAGCSIARAVRKFVFKTKYVAKYMKKYKKEFIKYSKGTDFNTVYSLYNQTAKIFPFFPSELFFWTWTVEKSHIDRFTIMPFFTALHKAITRKNLVLGKIICPYLTEHLKELRLKVPKKTDFEFLCVGHWGYGYPRMGIVRHDDPYVAELLAVARFHHLFSRTIEIIPYKFDFDRVKYQLYAPKKTNCFKPGFKAIDPLADSLFGLEQSGLDVRRILSKVESSGNIESLAKSVKNRLKSLKKYRGDKRYTGVVVWYKFKKCCW